MADFVLGVAFGALAAVPAAMLMLWMHFGVGALDRRVRRVEAELDRHVTGSSSWSATLDDHADDAMALVVVDPAPTLRESTIPAVGSAGLA